ncbi:MAG: glycosyltransferase family 9 protein [Kiritimatiellia bacterium]
MATALQTVAAAVRNPARRLAGAGRRGLRRVLRRPRRVLLLKTWNDRLGDLVLASGTLRHYRRLFAGARLELACADPFAEYFRHCPHVDAVVPLGDFGTTRRRYAAASPRNAGRYDRVVLLRRTPNARDYALLDGFRPAWTAGMAGDRLLIDPAEAERHEARLDCAAQVFAQEPPVHELEMQARLLRAVGAEVRGIEDVWPECWTTAADRNRAAGWLSGAAPGRPVVVVAPCGSAPIRDWNAEGFRRLLAALPACTLAWMGTQRDAEWAASLAAAGPDSIRQVDLTGKTTINEAVEVVRRADLVVAAEAAVFHLAAALRRPALCLAGGGHWGRFVPWGKADRVRVLTNRLDCFGCNWTCIRPRVECLQGIDSAAAARAAAELLGVGPEGSGA